MSSWNGCNSIELQCPIFLDRDSRPVKFIRSSSASELSTNCSRSCKLILKIGLGKCTNVIQGAVVNLVVKRHYLTLQVFLCRDNTRELHTWCKSLKCGFKRQMLLKTFFVPCLHKHLGTGKWIFNATFCISIRRSSPRTGRGKLQFCARSENTFAVTVLYSKHLTRTQFCTIMRIEFRQVFVNIRCFPRRSLIFEPVHLRSTRTIITQCIRYLGTR